MAEVIEMPKLSDTMTEGTVVKWLRKVGDEVASGDVIAEIETDKATMDLENFEDGVLLAIIAEEGDSVPCKQPIAVVGEAGEEVNLEELKKGAPEPKADSSEKKESAPAESQTEKEQQKDAEIEKPVHTLSTAPAPAANSDGARVKASPLAKKIAQEKGISLVGLRGTGPGGRIVKDDVLSFAEHGSAAGMGGSVLPVGPIAVEQSTKVSNMRKTIAKRLVQSKTEFPHFYVEVEVDADPMVAMRGPINDELSKLPQPAKLSFNDFVMKAAAMAMRAQPSVNASWEGETIRQFADVQLAFGVAIPDGLITPIIREAQNKNVVQISQEAKQLIAKAKEGKLKPDEFTGGTFTISNLGGPYGVDRFSAIINPPQAAILAVANIVKKPVVNSEDEIVIGHRMNLTLSADHRVVDGADAALYLREVKRLLESPSILLL
ncbi:MAG: pyruvate dehydrogenase complex dihydrolipoamide acetyltransferase [Verrucomicrobiota bacterium]